MKMKIERTKKGLPAMWESGGGYTNTGEATIIANRNGSPKKPVYIKRRRALACSEHALFIVSVGDLVIMADHHRLDFDILVCRIDEIDGDEAKLSLLHEFSNGEWDQEPPADIMKAVEAAEEKAMIYHCRRPVYYVNENITASPAAGQ